MNAPRTMFGKIWDQHVVRELDDGRFLIHIDRTLVHEGGTREAFAAMRSAGESVRRKDLTFGTIDHVQSTLPNRDENTYPPMRPFIVNMRDNCREFGIELIDMDDARQGIVHLIGPELAITLPGVTLVCPDSHTATHGGLGAWAWGIGTSEVRQVLNSQVLVQPRPQTMRVSFDGKMNEGVFAKDLILHLIGRYGVAAGTGHVIEYAGSTIRNLPIEARMTICNMSIEFGAKSGMIAPDDTTYEYLHGRTYAPKREMWDRALEHWRGLPTDAGAAFDREISIDCSTIAPQITWGNSPEDAIGIDQPVPDPDRMTDRTRGIRMVRALEYMGLTPGMSMEGLPIDVAFIGSCTNSRLSDLEAAAAVVRGRRIPEGLRALVVPGSKPVKHAAEAMGLDRVFRDAGFEWRDTGCSMCVASNGDFVEPGQRCISTSNRNFENRQGPLARTHLASPATVAASALAGRIADPRKLPA